MRRYSAGRGRWERIPRSIRRPSVAAVTMHYAREADGARALLLASNGALIAEKRENMRLITTNARLARENRYLRLAVAGAVGLITAGVYLCLRLWA